MSIELYPHNEKTYNKINELWNTTNKVAACQPTGTGKSFLILKCAEKFNGENIIILTPQIHIIEQFQRHDKGINGITYITYAKLQFMKEDEIKQLNPKLIVFDEFHRCGAEEWGNGVDRLLNCYPDSKVLGTSATPIRFLDGARDMSDELFDNNIACNMTLPEALVEGILAMPKYVSALYTFDEETDNMIEKINKSKNSGEEKNELINDVKKLKNKLDKSKGIPKILNKHIAKSNGRYLVFCKNKDHLEEMKPVVIDWFNKYFKMSKLNYSVTTYEVYSDLSDRDEQLEMFMKDVVDNTVKLLFCINMLNEGVHISNLDGVILLRPTTSPTMYYQQIGRAIDAGRKDQTLIFDLVNNFDNIRTNTLKEDLEIATREHCCSNSIGGGDEEKFIDKFRIYDETYDIMNLFSDIENRLYDKWDINIRALEQFYNREGHSNVVNSYIENIDGKDIFLGRFCSGIRRTYNSESKINSIRLDDERMKQLNKLEFNFDKRLEINSFEKQCEILYKYYLEYGNYNVQRREIYNDYKIGSLIQALRYKYRLGKLKQRNIEMLLKINFDFNYIFDQKWNEAYDLLKKYYEANGNSEVPSKYKTNEIDLGKWVMHQRRKFKECRLDYDKINKLKILNFRFIANNESNRKKVICLTTKEIFKAIADAKNKYNIKDSHISECCKGKRNYVGKLPDGTKLCWMYLDDYLKSHPEEAENLRETV